MRWGERMFGALERSRVEKDTKAKLHNEGKQIYRIMIQINKTKDVDRGVECQRR